MDPTSNEKLTSLLDWKDSQWQGAGHLEVLYLIILCDIIMEGC
jgi:hypothetical protein